MTSNMVSISTLLHLIACAIVPVHCVVMLYMYFSGRSAEESSCSSTSWGVC